jgi:ankyrin repeat protein
MSLGRNLQCHSSMRITDSTLRGLLESRGRTFDEWGSEILQASDLSQTDSVVVLSHFSVLEYLKSPGIRNGPATEFALGEETARIRLAEACLQYHSYVAELMAQSNRTRAEFPLIRQAYIFGFRHAEILGRQKWPDLLRNLIKYILRKGGNAFYLLKQLDSPFRESTTNSPLQYAIAAELWETIIFLIEDNVELDIDSIDAEFGRTPLSWASAKGRADVVKLLLKKGSNADSRSKYDRTPLSYAAENGHEVVVRMLLEEGAEADSRNTYGQTPLCWAAAKGHAPVVKRLLDIMDTDFSSKDKNGQTPLSLAHANGHAAIVDLLQGAKRIGDNLANKSNRTTVLLDDNEGKKQISESEEQQATVPLHESSLCLPESRLTLSSGPEILLFEEQQQRPTSPAQSGTDTTGLPAIAEHDDRPLASLLRAFSIDGWDMDWRHRDQTRFWPLKVLRHVLSRARVLNQLRAYTDLPYAETYVDYIRPEENELERSDTPSYLKIFALLLLLDRGNQIGEFVKEKLSDQSLPIHDLQSAPPEPFTSWEDVEITRFGDWQWEFLTPYFELGQDHQPKHFILDDKTILPWCETSKYLGFERGDIFRVKIQPIQPWLPGSS